MTPEQFAYWLQGFTELSPEMEQPTVAQWKAIKEHLQTVFVKVTPPVISEQPDLKIAPDSEQGRRIAELLKKAGVQDPYLGPSRFWTSLKDSPHIGPVVTC